MTWGSAALAVKSEANERANVSREGRDVDRFMGSRMLLIIQEERGVGEGNEQMRRPNENLFGSFDQKWYRIVSKADWVSKEFMQRA